MLNALVALPLTGREGDGRITGWSKVMDLVERMLAGGQQPLARLITLVERESNEVPQIMKAIQPHLGKAHIIGITGPPGAGKRTMAGAWRRSS